MLVFIADDQLIQDTFTPPLIESIFDKCILSKGDVDLVRAGLHFMNLAVTLPIGWKTFKNLGGTETILDLLTGSSCNELLIEDILLLLGKIATTSRKFRDLIINKGGITSILNVIKRFPNKQSCCFQCLLCLTELDPIPSLEAFQPVIDVLQEEVCNTNTPQLLQSNFDVLSRFLLAFPPLHSQILQNNNLLMRAVNQLGTSDHNSYSVILLLSLARNNDQRDNQRWIDQISVGTFTDLLDFEEKFLLQGLSLIAVLIGSKTIAERFCSSPAFLDRLLECIGVERPAIKLKGLHVLDQLCLHASEHYIEKIVQQNFLQRLTSLLTNLYVRFSCLQVIYSILRSGEKLVGENACYNPFALVFQQIGGVRIIQSITPLSEIFPLAQVILKNYFSERFEAFLLSKRGWLTKRARQPSHETNKRLCT